MGKFWGVGRLGHMFNVVRNCQIVFPKQVYYFVLPRAIYDSSSCFSSLPGLEIVALSLNSILVILKCLQWCLVVVLLMSSCWLIPLSIFSLIEVSIQIFCLSLKSVCFLIVELWECFRYPGYNSLGHISDWKYFLPICVAHFHSLSAFPRAKSSYFDEAQCHVFLS